ncbi:unnamed protein product [Amoebophrya sp. A120]|nr:unnamed protein product [Amoebophrya sp. A120]|eukprot:GSA120T00024913001.1
MLVLGPLLRSTVHSLVSLQHQFQFIRYALGWIAAVSAAVGAGTTKCLMTLERRTKANEVQRRRDHGARRASLASCQLDRKIFLQSFSLQLPHRRSWLWGCSVRGGRRLRTRSSSLSATSFSLVHYSHAWFILPTRIMDRRYMYEC